MNDKERTKGPWIVGGHPGDKSGTDWRQVLETSSPFAPSYVCQALKQDAEYIVKAVNSHDDLLAALKGCAAVLDAVLNGNGTDARDTDIALTIANRAILKATGTDTTTTGGK
jgi:hypothetical protein